MSRGERISLFGGGTLFVAVLVILYAPLALVVIGAFTLTNAGDIDPSTAGLHWFRLLFDNRQIIDALINSLLAGFGSVCLSLILSIVTALYVRQARPFVGALLQALIIVPFLLPPLVVGISLLVFFHEIGFPTGLFAVIVGHSLILMAVVFRLIQTRLMQLGASQIDAGYDLGATPWQVFARIILPQMASTIAISALLAFALSFDETLVSLFLVGDRNTLPIKLWAMMRTGISPEVNALATLVLALSLLLILFAAIRARAIETPAD